MDTSQHAVVTPVFDTSERTAAPPENLHTKQHRIPFDRTQPAPAQSSRNPSYLNVALPFYCLNVLKYRYHDEPRLTHLVELKLANQSLTAKTFCVSYALASGRLTIPSQIKRVGNHYRAQPFVAQKLARCQHVV